MQSVGHVDGSGVGVGNLKKVVGRRERQMGCCATRNDDVGCAPDMDDDDDESSVVQW